MIQQPELPVSNTPRKAWVAALLGLILGPVALMYCGHARRAAVWFVVNLSLGLLGATYILYWASGLLGMCFAAAFSLLPHLALIIDAMNLAKRERDAPLRAYQRWWVYGLLGLVWLGWGGFATSSIRRYWAEAFIMPTRSMQETLLPGDRFIVDRLARRWSELHHGDVVAHLSQGPGSPLHVKRVLGLPGDVIEIRNEKLFRNGEQLEEVYAFFEGPMPEMPGLVNLAPHTVAPDGVFLLGDHRRMSRDSRIDGDYPIADVIGVARVIFWSREYSESPPREPWLNPEPIQEWGRFRWRRVGQRLDAAQAVAGQKS